MATTALGIRPDGDNQGVGPLRAPAYHQRTMEQRRHHPRARRHRAPDLTYQVGAGTALIQPDGRRVRRCWPIGRADRRKRFRLAMRDCYDMT